MRPGSQPKVLEKVRVSQLLSIYGKFLSRKQAEILQLYFDEDLGFSEIAENLGITRQAVYDAARTGKNLLEKYEKQLGLLRDRIKESHEQEPPSGLREKKPGTQKKIQKALAEMEHLVSGESINDPQPLRYWLGQLKEGLQGR